MRNNLKRFFLALCLITAVPPALAAVDVREFSSPEQRERYQRLVEQLRCPKCQNQNLAGSDSPIAMDLRRELYRLLEEGKTDQEIKDFMVARYGDYVLYLPPVQRNTLLLWWGPPVVFGLAVLILIMLAWRRHRLLQQDESGELSAEDQQRLQQLLDQETGQSAKRGRHSTDEKKR